MTYLTFDEYINMGGSFDQNVFNRYIMRVCGIINNETHNRIKAMETVPAEVKYCVRDLVDYMNASNASGMALTSRSQSAGGVSESESYAQNSSDDASADIDRIVYDYLQSVKDDNDTPLLYRGGIC